MNYIQYNYYIIECLTRRKNQKNIPHCHFTKIDLNEKITLFAKLLLGKVSQKALQDFRKYCFCLKLKIFSKNLKSNS